MSRDHFFKKILNDWQIGGRCKKINQAIKFFSLQLKYFELFTFGMTVHCTSEKNYERKKYLKY